VKVCTFAVQVRDALVRLASTLSAGAGATGPRPGYDLWRDLRIASYAVTTTAHCYSAGDRRQRLFTTLALGRWHATCHAFARAAAATAVAPRCCDSTAPTPIPKELPPGSLPPSPVSQGYLPVAAAPARAPVPPPFRTLVDADTRNAATYTHTFCEHGHISVGNFSESNIVARAPAAVLASAAGGSIRAATSPNGLNEPLPSSVDCTALEDAAVVCDEALATLPPHLGPTVGPCPTPAVATTTVPAFELLHELQQGKDDNQDEEWMYRVTDVGKSTAE
jgi:hypothetical protein